MAKANSWSSDVPAKETKGGTGNDSYVTGDILYAAGVNNLDKLGIGALNEVLTSNGTSPIWASAAASGGSLVFLNNTTATNATSVSWGNTIITNTFNTFLIVWNSLSFSNTCRFRVTVSTNNGATYVSTNYQWANVGFFSLSLGANEASGHFNENEHWQIGDPYTNSEDNPTESGGFMYLFTPTSATVATSILGVLNQPKSTDDLDFGLMVYGGSQTVKAAHNAIKFSSSLGTFSGKFNIYGIAT